MHVHIHTPVQHKLPMYYNTSHYKSYYTVREHFTNLDNMN